MTRFLLPVSLAIALALALPLSADTRIRVTTTADEGPGSLRDALERANSGQCSSRCTIDFAIPGPVPASGYFTITPRTLLPSVTAFGLQLNGFQQTLFTGDTNPHGPEIELDGSEAPLGPGLKFAGCSECRVNGLAIHSFGGNGFVVDGGNFNAAEIMVLGADPTGIVAKPNGGNGALFIRTADSAILSSVISGNRGNGVFILDSKVSAFNNRIGAGRSEGYWLGNGANGIDVETPFGGDIHNNTIAYNAHSGVAVGARAGGVVIGANRIFRNGLLSIDLGHDGPDANDPLDADGGPNGRQNAPVILSAHGTSLTRSYARGQVTVTGAIVAAPNQELTIHAFAAGHRSNLGLAEARVYLGRTDVTTDPQGTATFVVDGKTDAFALVREALASGGYVTALAVSAAGSSELSAPVPFTSDAFQVTTTADSGAGSLRDAIARVNATVCTRDLPCWIAFRIAESELREDGVAVFEPRSPLPAIDKPYVYFDGWSQAYFSGDRSYPVVELRGTHAGPGAIGLDAGLSRGMADLLWFRDFSIRDFSDAGLRATALSVQVERVVARGNGGSGIALFGGHVPAIFDEFSGVRDSVASDNRGNGVYLDGSGFTITGSAIERNLGAGVLIGGGVQLSVEASRVAFNAGPGVGAAPGVRAVLAGGVIVGNGSLAIDRNLDGVSPNDRTEEDGVLDAPVLLGARYDAARDRTVVRAQAGSNHPTLPVIFGSGTQLGLTFLANTQPDASGHGEAERPLVAVAPYAVSGNEIVVEFAGDLRGQWITAQRTLFYCYWEAGCRPRESSELSNNVTVE